MRPVEGKCSWRVGSIELRFVKDRESPRCNAGVCRNTKSFQVIKFVAEEPAADVNRTSADVLQFDLILEGRQAVRKDFIEHHRLLKKIIWRLRRCASGKAYDVCT